MQSNLDFESWFRNKHDCESPWEETSFYLALSSSLRLQSSKWKKVVTLDLFQPSIMSALPK